MDAMDVQTFEYLPEKKTLIVRVNEKSEHLDNETFKETQWKIVQFLIDHPVVNLLLNLKEMKFVVNLTLQAWVGEVIMPELFKTSVLRVGYVMPLGFIENLSAEQTSEEVSKFMEDLPEHGVAYFEEEDEAILWFISNQTPEVA